MKYILVFPAFLSLVYISVFTSKVEAATNEARAKAVERLLAVHEVADVTNSLSEMQTLWPDQSQDYARCVNHTLNILGGAPSNEVTTDASRRLFANVARSSVPSNREDISSLLRLKCALVVQCLNIPAINKDISTWFDIASIVGEVRSQIVSNYVRQGQLNPPDVMQASSQEEAQRAITENRRKLDADRWQQELRVTDRKLTLLLLSNTKEVTSKLGELQREQAIGRIRSLARLDEVESRVLN